MKSTIYKKGLLSRFLMIAMSFFMCCCSESDYQVYSNDDSIMRTRSFGDNGDWICNYCETKNFEWKTVCVVCGTKYSEYHANFVTTLWNILTDTGFVTEIAGLNESNIGNRIQLPNKKFPSISPEPWYDNNGAIKYYNDLKNSFAYRFTPDYAEGVDYAWYITTHILYPGKHNKTTVEKAHDKWVLNEARYLEGNKGNGIKDGTKAAIQAFVNR